MLATAKETNGGAGVLYLFGNYSGDKMNFQMAAEMAAVDDIPVKLSIAADDVVPLKAEKTRRRGIAGISLLISSPVPKRKRWLISMKSRLLRIESSTRPVIGVALSPCVIPAVGKPNLSSQMATKWKLAWAFTANPY